MRRPALFVLVVLPGAAAVFVCGYYLFQDWSALISAFARYERAIASGADLRTLFVAQSLDMIYRVNAFADGVGVMLGAILFAIGLHGLCTVERPIAATADGGAPTGAISRRRVAEWSAAAAACLVAAGLAGSLIVRIGNSNSLRRAVIRGDEERVRQLVREGADADDRLWWGLSAREMAERSGDPAERRQVTTALRQTRSR